MQWYWADEFYQPTTGYSVKPLSVAQIEKMGQIRLDIIYTYLSISLRPMGPGPFTIHPLSEHFNYFQSCTNLHSWLDISARETFSQQHGWISAKGNLKTWKIVWYSRKIEILPDRGWMISPSGTFGQSWLDIMVDFFFCFLLIERKIVVILWLRENWVDHLEAKFEQCF